MISYHIRGQVTLRGEGVLDLVTGKSEGKGTINEALGGRFIRFTDSEKSTLLGELELKPNRRISTNTELTWYFGTKEPVFINPNSLIQAEVGTQDSCLCLLKRPLEIGSKERLEFEAQLVTEDDNAAELGGITMELFVTNANAVEDNGSGQLFGFQRPRSNNRKVEMLRTSTEPQAPDSISVALRRRANNLNFNAYSTFINNIFENPLTEGSSTDVKKSNPQSTVQLASPSLDVPENSIRPSALGFGNVYMSSIDAYSLLKVATDIFLLTNSCAPLDIDGLDMADERRRFNRADLEESDLRDFLSAELQKTFNSPEILPYLGRIVNTLPINQAIIDQFANASPDMLNNPNFAFAPRFQPCMIELIWSYWHEEAMLVQTMNAISMRFQNRRMSRPDPLAEFALDPLRPLSNLMWGFVQDEQHRLSLSRRVYEYDSHYGLTLEGKAVPRLNSVDGRPKFLEAFHNLLYMASQFYQEDDEATIFPDAFRLLRGIIDVHLILAEGAHNQFRDLPWTARSEMMMQQWMLQRPEMREFLRGRYMVPYQESWMGAVDSMRKLQGWSQTPMQHFRDLAVFGEQILLSIRYGDWIDHTNDQDRAAIWARYWRPEIQSYIYAYQAVTGVDLSADPASVRPEVRYAQPSTLIRKQLAPSRQPNRAIPLQRGTNGTTRVRTKKTD